MRSVATIGLCVLAAAVVTGGVFWQTTRFSRVIEQGAHESLSLADWTFLAEHPDDPRLAAPVAYELNAASAGTSCVTSFGRASDRLGIILARQKTSDDVSLAAITRMMTMCNEPKLLAWTTRPPKDFVTQLHKDIARIDVGPPNVLPDLLLRLKPKVDQDLIDVVVSTMKPSPSAVDAFFTQGFPPDGADFATGGPKVPPEADPRITHGIAQWLWSLKEDAGIQPDAASAILRILDHATGPKLDEAIVKCLGRGGVDRVPDGVKVCQRLATPADTDLITKNLADAGVRTGCLGALASAADAQKVLDGAAQGFRDRADETARAAWADEQATLLVNMGPKVEPVLSDALTSKDLSTRAVAERAFAKLDRHRFALGIAKSFRAGAANSSDAPLVETLLTEPPLELDAWFALFASGHGPTIRSVIAFVKDKSKPEEWVPELFAGIGALQSESVGAVAGYAWMLKETDGVAPIVSAVLGRALTAAGSPENVGWLTKLLALRTLAEKGTAKDAFAVEPFVADTSSYDDITTKQDKKTGALTEAKREKKPFSALATNALAAVKAR